jgi:hypothetical protein
MLLLVLKLSEGSFERLRYVAERARGFPGDVFLLGHNAEPPDRLPRHLKKGLKGGPVTITDSGPLKMELPDDLRLRMYLCSYFHCIVCGKPVSKTGSMLPTVFLSGHDDHSPGEWRSRVWVHYPCKPEGMRLAHQQGYGWKEPDSS